MKHINHTLFSSALVLVALTTLQEAAPIPAKIWEPTPAELAEIEAESNGARGVAGGGAGAAGEMSVAGGAGVAEAGAGTEMVLNSTGGAAAAAASEGVVGTGVAMGAAGGLTAGAALVAAPVVGLMDVGKTLVDDSMGNMFSF